jgi:hypothetical protein
MPFQLNPSKVPIWKNETDLRLGLNEQSQTIDDVSHAQERLINLLFQGIPEDQLNTVGKSVGLSEIETSELVDKLRPSLLNNSPRNSIGSALDVRFAEIIRIGFDTDETPESVLTKRANAIVEIRQLNRTGLLLLKTLCEAGFRRFETLDYEVVRRVDVGELSYSPNQLGISRLAAARVILAENNGNFELTHPKKRSRNVVRILVLTAMHQLNPSAYRGLEEHHVVIEYGIEHLRVSPVITPKTNPCLACRDLWSAENDSDWASTAIQLTARNDELDDGSGLLLAAAISAKTICEFVDSTGQKPTEGYLVTLKTRTLKTFGWSFHPACQCLTKR